MEGQRALVDFVVLGGDERPGVRRAQGITRFSLIAAQLVGRVDDGQYACVRESVRAE